MMKQGVIIRSRPEVSCFVIVTHLNSSGSVTSLETYIAERLQIHSRITGCFSWGFGSSIAGRAWYAQWRDISERGFESIIRYAFYTPTLSNCRLNSIPRSRSQSISCSLISCARSWRTREFRWKPARSLRTAPSPSFVITFYLAKKTWYFAKLFTYIFVTVALRIRRIDRWKLGWFSAAGERELFENRRQSASIKPPLSLRVITLKHSNALTWPRRSAIQY